MSTTPSSDPGFLQHKAPSGKARDRLKVLLIEQEPMFCEGLAHSLDSDTFVVIVIDDGSMTHVIEQIKHHRPHIIIIDPHLPESPWQGLLEWVHKERFPSRLILLCSEEQTRPVKEGLASGIFGHLCKCADLREITHCIQAVMRDEYYISPCLSGSLIDRHTRYLAVEKAFPALDHLTQTERKLLKLLAENKTSREIADECFVSVRTIQNERVTIARKLGIHGHNRLLQFAMENKDLLVLCLLVSGLT